MIDCFFIFFNGLLDIGNYYLLEAKTQRNAGNTYPRPLFTFQLSTLNTHTHAGKRYQVMDQQDRIFFLLLVIPKGAI